MITHAINIIPMGIPLIIQNASKTGLRIHTLFMRLPRGAGDVLMAGQRHNALPHEYLAVERFLHKRGNTTLA